MDRRAIFSARKTLDRKTARWNDSQASSRIRARYPQGVHPVRVSAERNMNPLATEDHSRDKMAGLWMIIGSGDPGMFDCSILNVVSLIEEMI